MSHASPLVDLPENLSRDCRFLDNRVTAMKVWQSGVTDGKSPAWIAPYSTAREPGGTVSGRLLDAQKIGIRSTHCQIKRPGSSLYAVGAQHMPLEHSIAINPLAQLRRPKRASTNLVATGP